MPFEIRGRFPLDAIVNVRLTTDEKARLKEDADLAGMSVSELVRRRYFGRPIIAHADIVIIRELRRLGGLLKHLYTSSNGEHARETLATLNTLRAVIEAISRDHQKD
ncbi:ribbon-helix-helix protein, CopG family [Acetobacter tropicalis]|uniref:OriT recognition-like protein n=1 Tax=Acetobacter tropicalis TaxID=104102 RepID=A0A095B7V7_9PROT|nr:ribbon-helix-helix protein, CopG family [Acetobacter tropicalis]KAA8387280.1 ribbon-helix-helix protein, CopG family [Acetobacter tropicalis]KAA8391050.1 ribbon-helix-helix protein, CopG family [Acetobacter tropicalis]KGB24878.1 oriT recognition-like protein [Acetobacter tropicalis]MBC9009727.1 ribbon-helix-helix protein, CopG family [Acetobacter tropicalis]MDO8172516.1 ribbon-helix-helix protein, CopG family [Acetobacter tropicalis]